MKKQLAVTLTTLAVMAVCTPAMADLKLATDKNCMACHSVEKKVVTSTEKKTARRIEL